MSNNETIIQKQLKDLHRLIFSKSDISEIREHLNRTFNFIKKNYVNFELSERLSELLNIIIVPKVIQDETYCNDFLLEYIQIYTNELSLEREFVLSIIFSKLLKEKEVSQLILFYIIKLIDSPILEDFSLSLENKNIFEFINSYTPIIENIVENSSSYQLFINTKLRNQLILYLYKQYKEKKRLNIYFPFSGCGVEPIIFSYLFHLIAEADEREIDGFHIIASDNNNNILKNGYNSNIFDPILEKIREDFCRENGLSIKEIKTTKTKSNKRIHLENSDFFDTNNINNRKIDFVLINSKKLSNHKNHKKEIDKILKNIAEKKVDRVLFEVKLEFERDLHNFEYEQVNQKKVAVNSFSENEDLNIYYLDLYLKKRIENSKKSTNFHNIYNNYKNYDKKEFKKDLENIKLDSFVNEERLLYSEMLIYFGYFSKAYEIIKSNYKYDYNKSLTLLKEIETKTENQKLKLSVINFIKDKKLTEYGFSLDIIDSLLDGIKEYREQKKDYKNLKWL